MANNKDKLIKISELAKLIGLVDPKSGKPLTHTLRFWESKFTQIKPTILSGNRRYYSEKDINTVKMINYLLKDTCMSVESTKSVINYNKIEYTKKIVKNWTKGYYLQRKEPREATVEHAEWQAKMNEVAHLAQIIIGKQRHGPIGNVTLEFEERFTKFKDTQLS